ncbi:UV DNA damage repair endonuclease UvsE [Neobacillus sp. PS3-40]|uniref:UV DNA damage repair endonuclease UvsE n=1 Tax=Neobacillus sp. PS3-40 TaxID=3070679 RepID=UPI0027E05BA8|nr:UV DNA damage repair endonuclease UvsE [Neobacillus sp. PS3-40]WML46277.1 UV DNA damage repair endonuclease UvsE [Neobacillus sp. PS3-40]
MKIRFGYVAQSISLWDASPSKTITWTRYQQLSEKEKREKLLQITMQNLDHSLRMLYFNIAHEIELYRFSSSIVPLATHPNVRWDFITPFREKWHEIGELVKKKQLRISFHPNQFTLFTSNKSEITKNAVTDMEYHYQMLEAMGLQHDGLINIHIGGAYGEKKKTIARFHHNLQTLPTYVKKVMTLENDDKTYNAEETLSACIEENIPFIFDYHHHMANRCEKPLEELIPLSFETWKGFAQPPKIHISSPKSDKEFRSHADFVDLDFILPFVKLLQELKHDVDFMIEAKAKDQAMLKLIADISKIRGIKRISGGCIELK